MNEWEAKREVISSTAKSNWLQVSCCIKPLAAWNRRSLAYRSHSIEGHSHGGDSGEEHFSKFLPMLMNRSLNAYCISAKTAQKNVAKTLECKLLLLHHGKAMQNTWGRKLWNKTRKWVLCLQVIGFLSKRLYHFLYQFLALFLHRKLGQNRHQLIAWTFILKHSWADMLRENPWNITNPSCDGCDETGSNY